MEIINIGGDTETVQGDILCFQLHGGPFNEYIQFTGPATSEEDFLRSLLLLPKHNGRMYVVWFHNLAFDLPAIFTKRHNLFYDREFDFTSGGWSVSGVFDNLHFATLRHGKLRIDLLDTTAYFKTSLAALAEVYAPKLPKLKAPKGLGEIAYTEEDTYFKKYAVRDVQAEQKVGQSISDMHERYSIPISVSAPHMASRIFRKQFLIKPIPLTPRGITYASLYSYHGGKNNFVGSPVSLYKDVRTIDIKSAYPFAMSQLPSFSDATLYKKIYGTDVKTAIPSLGVYKISGYAKHTDYPIIYTHNFKPIVGKEFDGVWVTGWEINQGLQAGLLDISELYGYYYDAEKDKEPSPFKGYVDHFYEMKETATNKGDRNFYKLLMNSLYGKFVETRGGQKLLNMHYDIDNDEHYENITLKGGTLFHPFIASQITGHTRAYIHSLESKYKAIHTATDGIMSRSKRATLSPDLGGLDIEADGDVLIFRNKLYIFYTTDKSKAVLDKQTKKPKRSTIFKDKYICKFGLHGFFGTVDELERMYIDDVYEYEFTKVNKLRESLRRNLKVNKFEKQKRTLNIQR